MLEKRHKRKYSQKPPAEREILFGLHTVRAALTNPARRIIRLHATQNAAQQLESACKMRGLVITPSTSDSITRILSAQYKTEKLVHQGVLLETEPLPTPALADLSAATDLLVALDQITDPRNVGAILRACAVFGVGGIVLTRRNAPPRDGVLAKAASGAIERVAITEIANLTRALETLAQDGFDIIGLDEQADQHIASAPKTAKRVIVMGAEGKGLRRLTREACTALYRLPSADAEFATLNVAMATAVALYALKN